MNQAKIEGELKPGELDVKRLYLPGVVVRATCPNCGVEVVYGSPEPKENNKTLCLSYPEANTPTTLGMYCGDGCEHEWTIPIRLNLSLEIIHES